MIKKLLLLLLLPTIAFSAPLVSSVTGTPADGNSIVIAGTGFGTHDRDIEWLGGASGNIETGTEDGDFSKTYWAADSESEFFSPPTYSTTLAHSGTQSILSEYITRDKIASGFVYNNDSKNSERFTEIYVTYWVYFYHVDTAAQWKQWRIRPTAGSTDTAGEIMQSEWTYEDESQWQGYTVPNGVTLYNNGTTNRIIPGAWYKIEIYAEESAADTADGTMILTRDKDGQVFDVYRSHDGNIQTKDSGDSDWQYFLYQNYYGNAHSTSGVSDTNSATILEDATQNWEVDAYIGGTVKNITDNPDSIGTITDNTATTITTSGLSGGTKNTFEIGDNYRASLPTVGTFEKIYIDDVYVQIGNRGHVEIINNATYANATYREIQFPTAWGDTEITITVNQVDFTGGAWLVVIDENGDISTPEAVTFGVSSTPAVFGAGTSTSAGSGTSSEFSE